MSVRTPRILLAAAVVTLGLYTTPAQAQVPSSPGVAVCLIAGFMDFDPGIPVPPAPTGSGGWHFIQVAVVCSGDLAGICFFTASGWKHDYGVTGAFGGNYNSTAPCIPTNQTCAGNVGGPPLLIWTPPTGPVVQLGSYPEPSWSYIFGPHWGASVDDVDCTGINIPPAPPSANLSNGTGIFHGVLSPTTPGACGNPSNAFVNYCEGFISGVALIVW